MNAEVDVLAKEGIIRAGDMYNELENIRITLINIRISVAKIDNGEARALDVIANHIEHSLLELETQAKKAQERYKKIVEINKLAVDNA